MRKQTLKQKIQKMTEAAKLSEVHREEFDGLQILISDGFSMIPAIQYKRFGVEPGEFPNGAFVTIWWIAASDEKFDVGAPLIFEASHDPGYDQATRQKMRVNLATKHAREYLTKRKAARQRQNSTGH